jgi:hypothetical protein
VLKNHALLTLALTLMVSLSFIPGVLALNYTNRQGNKACCCHLPGIRQGDL